MVAIFDLAKIIIMKRLWRYFLCCVLLAGTLIVISILYARLTSFKAPDKFQKIGRAFGSSGTNDNPVIYSDQDTYHKDSIHQVGIMNQQTSFIHIFETPDQLISSSMLFQVFKEAHNNVLNFSDTTNYSLNVTASISEPFNRNVSDSRPPICKDKEYPHSQNISNQVSIIIPYHLEHWSVLMRTLYSIYSRTDMRMIKEIILIDDKNPIPSLKKPLRAFLKQLPKIKLLQTTRREGLIRTRMIGARAAEGDILVILDAHIEVNKNWLPPLVSEILSHPKTIAIPSIDHINAQTLKYQSWGSPDYGIFDWELDYVWARMPSELVEKYQAGVPVPTATLLGCAMAMKRDYFFSLGGYDEGMYIWGGESLEISFRTWMCGGRLVIVPCSTVGHLFRSYLPYTFSEDILYKNLQRVAEVWMDDHKKWYFITTGKSYEFTPDEKSSLQSRRELRKRLHCHDFSWYLRTVATSVHVPKNNSVLSGRIKNIATHTCMTSVLEGTQYSLHQNNCNILVHSQIFHFTSEQRLETPGSYCIAGNKTKGATMAYLAKCDSNNPTQNWKFVPSKPPASQIFIKGIDVRKPVGQFLWESDDSYRCLQVLFAKSTERIAMMTCDPNNPAQFWIVSHRLHEHILIHDNLSSQ